MPESIEEQRVYEFCGFRLDGAVLQYGDAVVPLTPKAVDTLYVLVSRAPAVVGKEEMMKAVWPETFVVESSLARNISLIRKALEDHSGPGPYIETIPKRGYRFVAPVNTSHPARQEAPAPLEVTRKPRSRHWPVIAAAMVLLATALWWYLRRPVPKQEPDPTTLIGWHLLLQVTPEEGQRALRLFENAVTSRPDSAQLHAGLAEALILLRGLASGDADAFARAKIEAETAVRLDPRLGAAHSALGAARLFGDWNFPAAEDSLRTALRLDPASVPAMIHLSQLLNATGRSDEALKVARQAAIIDPVTPLVGVQTGVVLYSQHRFEEAARQFRDVLDRERNFALAHYYLALVYGYLGRFDEALFHLGKADLHPGVLRTDRAWLALRRGDPAEAKAVYEDLQRLVREGKVGSAAPLLLAVALGRLDDAFLLLDRSVRERAVEIVNVQSDPRLADLRADSRFLKAMGPIVRRRNPE